MAEEKDSQAPIIPDLKKKKEERKKSGVAAELPGGGSGTFNGARAGAAASRAAASAAARAAGTAVVEGAEVVEGVAASQGGFFSQLIARLVGSPLFQAFMRFAGTFVGKVAIGLACAMLAMAVGKMLKGGASGSADVVGAPGELAGIKSTIRVHMPSNKALDYAARAAGGALNFGQAKKAAPAPAAQQAPKTPEAPAMPEGKENEFASRPDTKGANFSPLSGAKLSSGFGDGSSGASFGKHDVFGNGPQVSSMDKGKLGGGFGRGVGSNARGGLSSTHARGGRLMAFRGGRNSKAMGQLRSMGPMGASIKKDLATGTGEAASSDATAQFEGAKPSGTAPDGPAALGGAGPSGGGVAPNINDPNIPAMLHPPVDISACTQDQIDNGYTISDDGTTCKQPKSADNKNDTPWQGELDAANTMLMIASGLIVLAGICGVISKALSATAKVMYASTCTASGGAAMDAAAMGWWIAGVVLSSIACVLGLAVMGIGIHIMTAYGQKMQGGMQLLGGTLTAAMAAKSIFSPSPDLLTVIVGALSGLMGMLPKMFAPPEPKMPDIPKPTLQDEGMLPPPPAGEHWESPNPNDPNPKDYKLVPDGAPPGNAPAGTTWVHDQADSGWSLEPTPPSGSDGKPLPQLPPGQHYENGAPSQDGMAPYSPPSGDHWMHNNVPNSDPNAWVLYDANGKEVGHSAGVDSSGNVYQPQGQSGTAGQAGSPGSGSAGQAGSPTGGSNGSQADPTYPPCAQAATVTDKNGNSIKNPNCN